MLKISLFLILITFLSCASDTDPSLASAASCVSNTNPTFTHAPFNAADILSIVPLGTVATGGETKNRLQIFISETTPRTEIPVYAPVDFTVTIVRKQDFGAPEVPYWGLRGSVSCELLIGLDHITNPGDKLRNSATEVTSAYNIPNASFSYSAGELIGTTIGTKTYAAAFDYMIFNTSIENAFINLDRYRTQPFLQDFLHADCPIRFQSAETKAPLEAKFGVDGPVVGADCRSAARDVDGALAGQWFSEGTIVGSPGTIGDTLAIQSEMRTPDILKNSILISIATGLTYHFAYANDPETDVTYSDPSEREVCYDDGTVAFYFEMTAAREMRVSIQASPCDLGNFPLADYQVMER